jgi:site-specific DNA recombinase
MRQGLNYLRVSSRRQVDKGFDEDGLSLPAQREACARYAADHAITIVGEYIERGESARSADRPAFQAMLARIQRDRDVQVVVVHKVDRFARNLEDHVTVRALLRRLGVELVSVVEPLDDSPQGRLTEGIHALMAEFYSANLAAEIRKGMTQKAKQGGWPHQAPLGYRNIRKPVGGRLVACIEPDPDRAHHILAAFQLYATGDWTLERLTAELAARGLCNRGRRDYPPKPLSLGGVAKLLANKAYVGLIDWNGVLVQGQHQPLVSPELFQQVQDLLAARSARGTRERKHHHYLKGVLYCAVCSRRYSYLVATGNNGRRYPYFYCLGTRPAGRGGCREPHIPADRLEDQVEQLYQRIQLPHHWHTELQVALKAEIAARQGHAAHEHQQLDRELMGLEGERRKLLAAYYADAIDLRLLRQEQTRISQRTSTLEARRRALTANLDQWQAVLETAGRFATNCAVTYHRADPRTRKLFNAAVIDRIEIRDGHITHVDYKAPFDLLFGGSGFEYRTVVELRGFEPLTPCMPCHPHHLTKPCAPLLGTASALPRAPAGQGAVVQREAACGIVADNLLTVGGPDSDPLPCSRSARMLSRVALSVGALGTLAA